MKVLAIGAHPDDVDLLCGGTLALYAKQGHDVFIAVATNGDVGSDDPRLQRQEIAEIRRREAAASAELIGAKLLWLGFRDEFLFDEPTTRGAFIDAIREAAPDVMFMHSLDDYHPDHRVAGRIARDSRIPTSVARIGSTFPACGIPTVFIMDTYNGRNFEPQVYVDITDVIETKARMLEKHDSQNGWMRKTYGNDLAEGMRVQARFRGLQAGTSFAEGFQLLSDWPYTGDWSLLP